MTASQPGAGQAAPGPSARTLLRGLRLLELLAEGCEGSVTQLSLATGLNKGTASRLLATLRDAGYLRQDARRQFHLTGKVLRLADGYTVQLDLRGVAHPFLARLRDEVDETVHLGVMDGDQVVYIDKLEAKRSLRLVSRLGHTEPVYSTSLGRAILSRLPRAERARLLASAVLEPRTPRTITEPRALLKLLEETEARGYAVDNEENQEEVACVGAAIVDVRGAPIAAVSCSGPAGRILERVGRLGQMCQQTAQAISDDLAGRRESRVTADNG